MPDAVCVLWTAVLTLAQAAPTSPAQPGASSPPATNWMPVAVVAAAVITAVMGRVVHRRGGRADLLDKQSQVLERQLEIAEQQEQERERLWRRTRALDAREKRLDQREVALDEAAGRRRDRRPGGGGETS